MTNIYKHMLPVLQKIRRKEEWQWDDSANVSPVGSFVTILRIKASGEQPISKIIRKNNNGKQNENSTHRAL